MLFQPREFLSPCERRVAPASHAEGAEARREAVCPAPAAVLPARVLARGVGSDRPWALVLRA